MMRIAIAHRDLHAVTRGGICTVYRELAGRFADAGHYVTLITQVTEHPLPPRPGFEVITLPRTGDMAAHRAAVAAALDTRQVDVAECSTWEAELLGYAARPADRRVPVLVRADLSAHTMGCEPVLVDTERELLGLAEAGVAVSRWAADDIAHAYGHQLPVLLNGVDRVRFRPGLRNAPLSSGRFLRLDRHGRTIGSAPVTGDTDALWGRLHGSRAGLPRLVWVGKLTTMKGADVLQEMLPALEGWAVVTVVLGHGLVQHPVTLEAHPNVQVVQDLTGQDLAGLYRSADYLLSTSRWEGFGLAIAEALACGTPALLPAGLGTARELVTDQVTGVLWRTAGDIVSALGRRPFLRGALPGEFDWDRNAAATLAMYETLVGAAQPAGR
ncbi:glycosyltransferase family 4 protein [Sphaerimonospora cavernae]|uniref:Glycosyltransferase family 4 protein n=1 Tax=Sphaerimonospora cavernae TaxID=1740611 RepID=A0ABV6U335_9ACTN